MGDANRSGTETHDVSGHVVTLVRQQPPERGYVRSLWAMLVDGEQRGVVVHPKGFGKPAELWSMLEAPRRGCHPDHRTMLDRGYGGEQASDRRRLAERIIASFERGRAPTLAEVEAERDRARLDREVAAREQAERRAAGLTRDADTLEALMALRQRLYGLGVLTNFEADLLETVIGQLPSGYPAGVREEVARRVEARAVERLEEVRGPEP